MVDFGVFTTIHVYLTFVGSLISIICAALFMSMTNTPEKQAAFAERASTYKLLPFGAWALARCAK